MRQSTPAVAKKALDSPPQLKGRLTEAARKRGEVCWRFRFSCRGNGSSGPHRLDERLQPEDGDHPLQVVGENMKAGDGASLSDFKKTPTQPPVINPRSLNESPTQTSGTWDREPELDSDGTVIGFKDTMKVKPHTC
jgi:hypothetical protein